MKKRNLFLSLICSIILTITLVTFTVIGIVNPQNGNENNNGQNAGNVNNPGAEEVVIPVDINKDADGSAEKPYYIYSVESFDTLIKAHGAEGAYFELYTDIDFAGVDFIPYFNQDVAFNGHIIGKEHSLKNISINVSKDNFDAFIYEDEEDRVFDSHIAVFGNIENAEISGVSFEGLTISVADDVYSTYVPSGGFATEKGYSMRELTVASVAAVAKNSTISVTVDAVIDADAYAVYVDDYVAGYNAVGGVVAVSDGSTITDSYVKATILADSGKNYFVGGVAGYAYNTTISKTTVDLSVSGNYKQVLYVGGAVGYAKAGTISEMKIALKVAESSSERYDAGINATINESKTTWVAGVVTVVRADSSADAISISDVEVVADVDIDAIYAGAIVEVRSTSTNYSEVYVTIKDVILDSKVNVLQAYGMLKKGAHVSVELTKTELDASIEAVFNIRLVGTVKLENTSKTYVASLLTFETVSSAGDTYVSVVGGFNTIKVVTSESIADLIEVGEALRIYARNAVIV